jgi:hypothetical protein
LQLKNSAREAAQLKASARKVDLDALLNQYSSQCATKASLDDIHTNPLFANNIKMVQILKGAIRSIDTRQSCKKRHMVKA